MQIKYDRAGIWTQEDCVYNPNCCTTFPTMVSYVSIEKIFINKNYTYYIHFTLICIKQFWKNTWKRVDIGCLWSRILHCHGTGTKKTPCRSFLTIWNQNHANDVPFFLTFWNKHLLSRSILPHSFFLVPTKVCLVKSMVFLVVMYGCESWTIRKAECRRIDAFELWCWRRLLRVPWTARRSNQSILKDISPGVLWKEWC